MVCQTSDYSRLFGAESAPGIKDFATPFAAEALDRTYPVLLRKAGYRTGFMGKWGVGASSMKALPAAS